MRELIEFRILERYAKLFLEPDQGSKLGGSVRRLIISKNDPLYERIGHIDRQLRQNGEYLFHGWDYIRRYSQTELQTADLFHLEIQAVFEPAGEECGTVYDESEACKICGGGRKQVTNLILDLRRIPKGKDIARSIADEWVVSQELSEKLVDAKLSGFELRPVQHQARYQDDPVDLLKVPSGKELIRRAVEKGYEPYSWGFYVWINRSEQYELAEKAREEHSILLEKSSAHKRKVLPNWFQLVVTSNNVRTVSPTCFKTRPFSSIEDDESFSCPLGHVSGLNLFSEVWVSRHDWDGSDFIQTENMVGTRRGLLVPTPLLLISPRVWKLFREADIRGYRINIAHFV
jgi:hypothetical protein